MVIVPTAAWLTQNRRICGHSSAAHQDEDEDEDEGEDDEDDVYHHWLSLWWWSMLWFFIQRVIAIPISAEHFPVIFSVPKKWRQKSQQHGVSAWIQTYYNVCIYIYTMYYRGKKENTCDSSHFSTSDCLVSPWKISLASGRPPLSPLVPSFWTSSWYDLSGWNPRFRIQSNEVPTQFMVQILGKAYLEWWRNKPQKKVLRDGLVWKTTLQRRIQ